MPPLETIENFNTGWASSGVVGHLTFPPDAAYDVKNIEWHPRGAMSKREGFLSYNLSSTPISGVMNLYPWKDKNGTDITFAFTTTSSGNLSADVYSLALTAGSTTALTAQKLLSAESYANRANLWNPNISADEVHVTSYGGSAIAVAGGAGPPLMCSGVNTSAVPATSIFYSGAKYIEAWGNYLFLGNIIEDGVRQRSRIRWNLGAGSVWLSATSWPASYYIDVDADDGDEITGMKLLKDFLVIFKRHKIFLVWYTGDATIFTYRRQSADIGCMAGRSIIQKGEYLYFLGDHGFYRFDSESPVEISQKIKDQVIDNISHSLPSLCSSEVYDLHRQIWFAVNYTPFDDASESSDSIRRANAIFVYDYELKNWTLYDIRASSMANCILDTSTDAQELILGHFLQTDTARKSCISRFGEQTSDIFQNPIASHWVSKWLMAQDPNMNKRVLRTTIIADQEGVQTDNYSLNWELREDWKATKYNFIDATAASGTVYLTGSSTSLSGETVESNRTNYPMEIRIDNSRTLRAWQLKLSNSISGHPWTIHKIIFDGMMKGRTKVT